MLADGDTDPKMSWSKQEIYELDVLNSLLSIVDGGSFQETYFFFMAKTIMFLRGFSPLGM